MMQKHKVIVFDLDDTLYKEIDFLKSAYREIANFFCDQYGIYGLWGEMLRYYGEGKDVFQELINLYNRDVTKDFLIEMYRNHMPEINLDDETKCVLDYIKANPTCSIGLITDGREVTQTNKIDALGLLDYVDDTNIFISETWQHDKIDGFVCSMIEEMYPNCNYVYVGDNPQKDFLAPNQRGWDTICLLDNGRNIHKQVFDLAPDYLPKYRIRSMTDLKGIISK